MTIHSDMTLHYTMAGNGLLWVAMGLVYLLYTKIRFC